MKGDVVMAFLDFAALKESVRIEDAIQLLDLPMKSANNQWRGPCPICKSGGPRSLVVTPAKQAFYCFGARLGGDVIALAAHIRQSDMKSAAEFLADGNSDLKSTTNYKSSKSTVPQERVGEREQKAVRSLQPLSYLEPDHPKLHALGIAPETCASFGAGYAPKGIMRGKLAFPIHDQQGTLVAYGGIALEGDPSEMSFPKDYDPELFIFNFSKIGEGDVLLCRSPFEVLMASQNGIENAISFLTPTLSAGQLELLAEYLEKTDRDIELP